MLLWRPCCSFADFFTVGSTGSSLIYSTQAYSLLNGIVAHDTKLMKKSVPLRTLSQLKELDPASCHVTFSRRMSGWTQKFVLRRSHDFPHACERTCTWWHAGWKTIAKQQETLLMFQALTVFFHLLSKEPCDFVMSLLEKYLTHTQARCINFEEIFRCWWFMRIHRNIENNVLGTSRRKREIY